MEGVLRRRIDHQVVNDYRVAISALNSGEPFMQGRADSVSAGSLLESVRGIDVRPGPAAPHPTQAPRPSSDAARPDPTPAAGDQLPLCQDDYQASSPPVRSRTAHTAAMHAMTNPQITTMPTSRTRPGATRI